MGQYDAWEFDHPQGWFDPATGEWTAAQPSLPAFATAERGLSGKGSPPPDQTSVRLASPKQLAFLASLLDSRVVDPSLHADATTRLEAGLTHDDCARLIPLLQACPCDPRARRHGHPSRSSDQDEDWTTPEGYDDSPDQGVHRYDGGGAW